MVAEKGPDGDGIRNCPWVAYLHNNERVPGQHLHLVLSRVSFDGKIVSDQYERFRVMEVMRGLRWTFAWSPCSLGERSRSQAYPHDAKGRAQDREFIMLRAQIDAAGVNARTIPGFVERLGGSGSPGAPQDIAQRTPSRGELSTRLQRADLAGLGSRPVLLDRALAERFGLAQEGDVLRAVELGSRDLERLRSVGLEPDRVEACGGGRAVASWLVQGSPRDQDVYQRMVQAAVPGRLCDGEAAIGPGAARLRLRHSKPGANRLRRPFPPRLNRRSGDRPGPGARSATRGEPADRRLSSRGTPRGCGQVRGRTGFPPSGWKSSA